MYYILGSLHFNYNGTRMKLSEQMRCFQKKTTTANVTHIFFWDTNQLSDICTQKDSIFQFLQGGLFWKVLGGFRGGWKTDLTSFREFEVLIFALAFDVSLTSFIE